MNGTLKRKFEEVEEDPCYSSSSPSSLSSSAYEEWDSDGGSIHSDMLDSPASRPCSPADHPPVSSILKKTKRLKKCSVQFDQVTVFNFPRCQGFTSVPSRGGCTLGMVRRHSVCQRYTLAEFTAEQRQRRWEKVKKRLKEEKLQTLKQKLTKNSTWDTEEANRLTIEDIPDEDIDLNGMEPEDGSFLHPYPSKMRYSLLKAAGVKKIDREEKRQLHDIRLSREDCGCDCQGFCEPETCACSLAGIKCQMDHSNFPCGCTKDGCGNTEGRIEFNSSRVHTHYIHTVMKLELEKRLEESSKSRDEDDQQSFCSEESPVPVSASFHLSPELVSAGENSCSSDMTDSSSSSDSEEGAEPRPEEAQLDVDENGLTRILSFSDSEDCSSGSSSSSTSISEDCCGQWRQQQSSTGISGFSAADFFPDHDHTDNQLLSISEMLDENANQTTRWYPSTPYPTVGRSNVLTDLSFSSDSDLEFFDGFPGFRHSPLYNSLKECEFQFPNYPSQANESSTCFLDSLIGLTDSVSEPPTAFTENQLLEDAIKTSVSESVKV